MATDLNRKRSATSGALSVTNPNIKATNRKPARVYSVSSDIVPQALTHPDEDVHLKHPNLLMKMPLLDGHRWGFNLYSMMVPMQGGRRIRLKRSTTKARRITMVTPK